MFFSGNLLPLATESSIELHMSFFCSSFFSSEAVPTEILVYVQNLLEFAVMVVEVCQMMAFGDQMIALLQRPEGGGTELDGRCTKRRAIQQTTAYSGSAYVIGGAKSPKEGGKEVVLLLSTNTSLYA